MIKAKDKSWAEQVWLRWMVVLAVLLIAAGSQATAERSALTTPRVPVIEGDYVRIYEPQGDVFSGPDTRDLKAGQFYLFWCLRDTANKNGNGYDERSFVYCSDNPLDFHGHPRIAELKTHAPEIFQDERQNWYISSAQYPARGISVARLAWMRAAATAPTPDAVRIGFSKSVPSVGERIVVRLYVDDAADQDVRITFPDGRFMTRKTDEDGTFVWIPRRYGKYVFRLGEITDTIWVTTRPMNFFVWDSTVFRRYVTHVLKPREEDRCTLWRRRGVRLVNWAGGEHLSRQSKYGDRAFTTSSQWVENWRAGTLDRGDGVTIDEIFVANRPPMGQLCKAVLEFRRIAGEGFDILPFFSGIEWDAVGPMWDLREADVPGMEENYWGGAEVYGKRWADVCLFHLDEQGTVLSQAPGFYLDESRRGPRTIEEFRADVALCRRIAPQMRGLSLFNAYDCREVDHGADEVIEDLFFRPVIHLHPRNGKLMVQNIGNEDTAEGTALAFLAGDNVLEKVAIPVSTPYQETAFEVPAGAKRVRLELSEGMHSIYEDGVFELPENLDPLQVLWCSIRENDTIELDGDGIQIRVRFNKPVKPIDVGSVWLRGALVGMVAIDAAELSEDRETLSITIDRLPEDRYSLRLLSGKSHFRDDAGRPLDGSGNGFCENAPGLYKDADHFAVDFRAVRRIW